MPDVPDPESLPDVSRLKASHAILRAQERQRLEQMLEDPEVSYLAKQLLKNHHKESGASVTAVPAVVRKSLVDQRVVLDSLNWILACSGRVLRPCYFHTPIIHL